MRLHLCGVRGSTAAPGADFLRYGGHTSCVAVSHDDSERPDLILDAGTGIRAATDLLGGQAYRGTILLTHLHWDHVQGLPFFSAGDDERSQVELLLPEQDDGADAVSVLARAISPPHFPMEPTDMRGEWSFGSISPGGLERAGFSILAREVPHKGGRTFGYRISDGRAAFTYIPDHRPTAFGPGPDGFGEYHEAALELTAGSDLLIHDSQLLVEELAVEGAFGHSCGEYAVELARRAGCPSVMLFHHRPDRTDDALDALAGRFSSEPQVTLAAQGSQLAL
jgi:phosphoribosyl 1,2-cyclic phosphodiesterase